MSVDCAKYTITKRHTSQTHSKLEWPWVLWGIISDFCIIILKLWYIYNTKSLTFIIFYYYLFILLISFLYRMLIKKYGIISLNSCDYVIYNSIALAQPYTLQFIKVPTRMTFSISLDGHQWNIPVESYLFTLASMLSICSFPGMSRGSCLKQSIKRRKCVRRKHVCWPYLQIQVSKNAT